MVLDKVDPKVIDELLIGTAKRDSGGGGAKCQPTLTDLLADLP